MASNIRNYIDQNREEAAVRAEDDAADAALQSEIDQIESSIGLETDGTLSTISGNYTTGAGSIVAAIQAIDTKVKDNTDDIVLLGDPSAMQNEIDAIEIGAGLETNGAYNSFTGSNYIDAATSLKNADYLLDAAIDTVASSVTSEASARASADTNLQIAINTVEASAGLETDGSYDPNTAANYISTASSLKDADNRLDAAIFAIDESKLEITDVVGTVSQIGGVPTGAIIESGSNSNGNYIKYADGTMICTFTGTASSGEFSWTFPQSFNTIFYASAIPLNVSGYPYTVSLQTLSTSETIFNVFVATDSDIFAESNASLRMFAIGKWF